MSFENNNSYTLNQPPKSPDWSDKNFQIPQSKMNKLIMDYLVTGNRDVTTVEVVSKYSIFSFNPSYNLLQLF